MLISKEVLKSIVDLSESLPEQYRAICFEILLREHLTLHKEPAKDKDKKDESASQPKKDHTKKFVIPIDVKAFLNQYNLSEDILWKLFLADGDEVRPIYTLKETKKSKTEIQYSLMMALENALRSGNFQVELENLRQRCADQKSYDAPNFIAHLRNNGKYYKTVDKEQPLVLSPDGKAELADLIEQLIK